jgi:cyclopropane-fatty-acyl-phospholipid synthase
MYKDFTCDDVPAFLEILAENRDHLMDGKSFLPIGLNYIANAVFTSRISNSVMNSLGNISAHYDLGNEMFEAFLDKTMTYSCPIWSGQEDEPLEDAQWRKIRRMLDTAAIKKGHLVLEIGTG